MLLLEADREPNAEGSRGALELGLYEAQGKRAAMVLYSLGRTRRREYGMV